VSPSKFWVEQREHVIVHGSESGLRLVAESIVESVDDLLLEVIPTRMRLDYRFPVSVGHIKVANPENIHLDPMNQAKPIFRYPMSGSDFGIRLGPVEALG
jgi:hypothetical protein